MALDETTREWVNAKLEASEARTTAAFADLRGDIRELAAQLKGSVDLLASELGAVRSNLGDMRAEVRDLKEEVKQANSGLGGLRLDMGRLPGAWELRTFWITLLVGIIAVIVTLVVAVFAVEAPSSPTVIYPALPGSPPAKQP